MTSTHAITVGSFADRLRSLDDETFASFVADLRRSVGWDASTDGAVVTATRQDPTTVTRRIRVLADDRSLLARFRDRPGDLSSLGDVDELVAAYDLPEGEAPGVRVTGPGELYQELFYAVDRETCRAICERYFGQILEPLGPSERGRDARRRQLERVVERVRGNRRSFAALAATVLLLAAVTVGALGSGGGGPVVQPGGGTVPDGNAVDVTPVGGGSPGTTAPGTRSRVEPAPSATTEPEGVRRNETAYWNESAYFFDTSGRPAVWFAEVLSSFGDNQTWTTDMAVRFFTPTARPNQTSLRAQIRNGSYRHLWTLEDPRTGRPPGFSPLQDTESAHRGYLVVGRGESRVAYRYTSVCQPPEDVSEDICWRLRNVTFVGPVNGSTPESPVTESTQTG